MGRGRGGAFSKKDRPPNFVSSLYYRIEQIEFIVLMSNLDHFHSSLQH